MCRQVQERRERFEIVSMVGTLGFDPATDTVAKHLHLALADGAGKVWGGHVLSSLDGHPSGRGLLPVFTTAEVTLMIHKDLIFGRAPDPTTGFQELSVQAKL